MLWPQKRRMWTASTSKSLTSQSLTKKQPHVNNDKFISSKKQKCQSYSKDKDNEDKDNEDKDNRENNKDQDMDNSEDKEDKEDEDDCSLLPSLPDQPTAADVCKADKVIAKEKACNQALGASCNKVGAQPATAPKGKGMGKGKKPESSPIVSKAKNTCQKEQMPLKFNSKRVCCVDSTLSKDEDKPAKAPKKAPVKTAPKANGKKTSKGATSGKRHKELASPISRLQMLDANQVCQSSLAKEEPKYT
ncbi:hypothetical protein RHS01_06500 [Rhizoctonia solani]|uniref:Uncharacterized protein n=1 Tax=Rhizoctonia solani TaxID=456999 RepID=A0A8H7M418_9AGAM|nr:hypothetical protein RHS01_10386 [Rhizoctonia solani]KAF8749836.1 hypothetical protein RHS01_09737 [Rhizoctonia solani]KAF8754205.1 hypothetical protein RHS01_06500 [Rhizoctonia solani]